MDEGRAAGHLSAAGELDAAAKRYCTAAAQAIVVGAHAQALAHAQQALALLERLPVTPERRRLRVSALIESARVHWMAAAPSQEAEGASFTLGRALELLDEARARIAPEDPPALHAELSTLIADICYDLGDLRSLERALDELTSASRRLLEAGDATGAARLLNDQAALYVRMGDPVRAAHLLGESRKVFEERAATDPVALLEMAETDHLFARIPLHVPARPGREGDALSMGLDHAIAAERTYKRIGAGRELARVWETMGRLELRKGRLDRATERLSAAVELQQNLGDLVGLARSTAAFSEVLTALGRHRDALMVLSDSIGLNLEKGSPIGLAFNRRSLDALAATVSPLGEAADVLHKVAAQLEEAEAVLGRMGLASDFS
jgi:tetratricopeptide (TPR) repeat protein